MQTVIQTIIVAAGIALCGTIQPARADIIKKVPLSSVKIDYDALRSDKITYGIAMIASSKTAKSSSSMTFKARMTKETEVTADKVIMHDTLSMMSRTFDTRIDCARKPTLDINGIELKMSRRDTVMEGAITIKDGKATIVMGEKTKEFDMPTGLVTTEGLFRIIPQLPRTPGIAYTFDSFSESALELRPGKPREGETFSVVCIGPENIDIDEKTIACTRFELTAARKPIIFHVDKAGAIQQVEADGGQTIMRILSKEFLAKEAAANTRELEREEATRDKSFDDLIAAIRKAFPEATVREEALSERRMEKTEGAVFIDIGNDHFKVRKYKTIAERRVWHSTHKDNPDHIQDGLFAIGPMTQVKNRANIEKMRAVWKVFCPE